RKRAPRHLPHLEAEGDDPYLRWQRHNRIAPALHAAMEKSARALATGGPVIAVIADLRGTTSQHVTDLVASLQAQIYPRWELWLVVPNGTRGLDWTARRLAGKDDRIQRRRIKGRSDYTSGLNAALNQSK